MEADLIAISEDLTYARGNCEDEVEILSDAKNSLQHLARCPSTFQCTPITYTKLDQLFNLQNEGITITL